MARPLLDALTARLARGALGLFFRSLEVRHRERVPEDGPLVVVANHVNSLVDPALLLAVLPRPVRFLGKSTLWDNPALRPFLALAGVVPVYRPTDPGVDPSKNRETFARCREALLAGEAIALFPEGTSHNEPRLLPMKTGAARIALDAQRAGGDGGPPVRILPVGLAFDARDRFRSRALVVVGEPFELDGISGAPDATKDRTEDRTEEEADAAAQRRRVRRLTERIEEGLREVTLGFTSWRQARLFARAAEIFARPDPELPGHPELAATHRVAAELVRRHEELERRAPEETAELRRRVARYDRTLSLLGLRDDQVAARYPLGPMVGWLLRSLAFLLLVALPGLVGMVLNLLPYRAVDRVARWRGELPDQASTWKLFGALFLYPAAWLLEGLAAALLTGSPAVGLAVAVAAALAAVPALMLLERWTVLVREARAFLMLRTRPSIARRLRALRADIQRRTEALAARDTEIRA